MSFFSQKKAPAASRRAHKKSFKQHQQHKNKTRTRTKTHKKYINYVENGMYQPHLSRKFKLRRFHMEIDRKNGAILVSMLPEQIEKHIIFKK